MAQAAGLGRRWEDTLNHALGLAESDLRGMLIRRGVDPEAMLRKSEPGSSTGLSFLESKDLLAPEID